MPTRKATARWKGGFKTGRGELTTASGAVSAPYTAGMRFGEDPGTNPEELLAAAHAGCYAMALSLGLENEGHPAESIETRAACTIEKQGAGFAITRMRLEVRVKAPGLAPATFERIAAATKDGCPVSKVLAGNLTMELDAQLTEGGL